MKDYIAFGLLAFTSFLAMIDPLGAVPMFLAVAGKYDDRRRRDTVTRAVVTAFIVLVVFGLLGLWIFKIFGITPHAFRIAGGIVLFEIGREMLQARKSRTKTSHEEEEDS